MLTSLRHASIDSCRSMVTDGRSLCMGIRCSHPPPSGHAGTGSGQGLETPTEVASEVMVRTLRRLCAREPVPLPRLWDLLRSNPSKLAHENPQVLLLRVWVVSKIGFGGGNQHSATSQRSPTRKLIMTYGNGWARQAKITRVGSTQSPQVEHYESLKNTMPLRLTITTCFLGSNKVSGQGIRTACFAG